MAGKYVVGEARVYGGMSTEVVALLLPLNVNHDSLKRYFIAIKSAGFFKVNKDGTVETYGVSESLGMRSMVGDAELVQKVLDGYHSVDH